MDTPLWAYEAEKAFFAIMMSQLQLRAAAHHIRLSKNNRQ